MKKNEVWYPAEIIPRKLENVINEHYLNLEIFNAGKKGEYMKIHKSSKSKYPIELYILDFNDDILAEPSEIKWFMNDSEEIEELSIELINKLFKEDNGWVDILVEYDEENDLEIPILKEGFVIIKKFKK